MALRLRTKLTLAYLVPFLALFLGAGLLAHRAAHRGLEAELGLRLAGIAQTISGHFQTTREGGRLARLDFDPESSTRARLNHWLQGLREATGVRRVFVFRQQEADGTPISVLDSDSGTPPGTVLFDLEPDRAVLAELAAGDRDVAQSILFSDADGSRYLNGYAAVRLEGETVGIVGVAGSAAYFDALDTFRTALLAMGLLVIGLVIVVSVAVSYRLTRPIARLVDAIGKFGRGELKQPVEVHSRDEIGFLADAFNDMRERLDRRDEQMQLMLSGIAHEVRNPLAGMELFCGLLRDDLADQPESVEHVDRIVRELGYLARVVNDFLRYARRRPLSPERFDASTLVAEVVDGIRSQAQQGRVEVSVQVEDGLDLTGEREALRGVLANILQNAVQACDGGGRVEVRAEAAGAWRVVDVSDDGPGIPPEKLKKIFEPFFTTKEQGTGLGLALVMKTVREHGGDIEVQSSADSGTRFRVRLPFDAALSPLVHLPEYEGSGDEMEMIG